MNSYTIFAVRFQFILLGRISVEGYEGQFEVRYKSEGGNKCSLIVLHECWRTDKTAKRFRPLLILKFNETGEGHVIDQQADSGFEFLNITTLGEKATQILNSSCCHINRLIH